MARAGTGSAFVAVSPDVYQLQSALTFATVAALRHAGIGLIESAQKELTFGLQAVPAVDSAGLALLIDWLAIAKARSRRLRYAQPPQALLSLARLSDVDKLIV
jgi:phospholipid transport system transporter-binding protein